jgi:hypothetical protein
MRDRQQEDLTLLVHSGEIGEPYSHVDGVGSSFGSGEQASVK